MRAEVPHVVDVATQKQLVHGISDLNGYLGLNEALFDDKTDNYWHRTATVGLSNPDFDSMPPDFMRLLGLAVVVFAQFGYPHLYTHLPRHRSKGWKKSPFDPKHQLALTCYGADKNAQSYRFKDRWSKRLAETDPDASTGVWGMDLKVEGGLVVATRRSLKTVQADASNRFKNSRPICLPDRELNDKLAAVEFTGDDAERMSDSEFEEEILPKAAEAVKDYVDLEPVFSR